MSNSSIWLVDRTHSGESGPGSNGNEGVLRIPQSSSITGVSASYCLVSYLGHSLEESYLSVELQSMYSIAPAYWIFQDIVFFELCLLWSWIIRDRLQK